MRPRKTIPSSADAIRSRISVRVQPYQGLYLGLVLWGLCIRGFVPAVWAVQLHYVPTDYRVPATVAEAVRQQLPRLIQSHQVLFRRKVSADLDVQIQVVRNRKEYAEIAQPQGFTHPNVQGFTRSSKVRNTSSGLFQVTEIRIVTWAQRDESVLTAILLHELTHALTETFTWRAPDWFMEGSAELLGAPAVGPHRLDRQTESRRWQVLLQLLKTQRLPALREFMRASSHDWDRLYTNRIELGYTTAYSLFHFFVAHPNATRLLMSAVNSPEVALAKNPNLACVEYLNQRWPGGISQLEKEWHQWIQQQAATNGTAVAPAKPSTRPGALPGTAKIDRLPK